MGTNLGSAFSQSTLIFGLKVWEVIGMTFALLIIVILSVLSFCLTSRKRSRRVRRQVSINRIPAVSKEIKEVHVEHVLTSNFAPHDGILLTIQDKSSDKESGKVLVHFGVEKLCKGDNSSQSGSSQRADRDGCGSLSGGDSNSGFVKAYKPSSFSRPITTPSPLSGLHEFSHLGWGLWFTLRDLEVATNRFSKENVIGEGGYGVVYRGCLINGTPVAIKKILNNL